MRQTNFALALLAAAALTACGGSDNNTPAAQAKPVFAAQISFGDSLSDVGTYAVGTVAALGGGKYTINGNNTAINAALHGKNWTELMAAQMSLAAPCPAQTGLKGVAAQGFAVPVVDNLACFGYAQGGARVTADVGPGNAATGAAIGQLTVPVEKQIKAHLARASVNGAFKATDIVYVLAGGNDAFMLLGGLTAAATAAGNTAGGQKLISSLSVKLAAGATNPTTAATAIATAMATEAARTGSTSATIVGVGIQTAAGQPGNAAVGSPAVYGPMVAAAQAEATAAGTAAATAYGAANGPALPPQMADAGTALAKLVKEQIVAKGATHVVLINLPDLVSAPSGASQSASSKQLIGGMVSAFNIALRLGIDGIEDKVLFVDAYTASVDQVANPSKYGISNATAVACGANALGTTSLVCKASNTLVGVDVSHYLFADDVHPAPYGQTLLAKLVADSLTARGWL
jgi:outer membrane lipase/esterase